MKYLYGFVGALLGAVLGVAAEIFIVTVAENGDDFGVAFTLAVFGLVGLVIGAIVGIVVTMLLLRYVKKHQTRGYVARKAILAVAGFALAVPLLVVALLWGAQQYSDPPSDQHLLADFARHRADLDNVAQMKQVDKNLSRVDYNWTEPDNPQKVGVSPQRIAQYRSLLESAGVHRGFEAYKDEVDFLCWCQGSAISSDTDKGYAYLTVPPKQVLSSLDNYQFDDNAGKVYRHIEGCWYLYYDYIPG